MSKINQLKVMLKKARKVGGNKILLEVDFAKGLMNEISDLQEKAAEPSVVEALTKIEQDLTPISVELQGGKFK